MKSCPQNIMNVQTVHLEGLLEANATERLI
jgi:hypothetical protein